jgi:hypothetical protein
LPDGKVLSEKGLMAMGYESSFYLCLYSDNKDGCHYWDEGYKPLPSIKHFCQTNRQSKALFNYQAIEALLKANSNNQSGESASILWPGGYRIINRATFGIFPSRNAYFN